MNLNDLLQFLAQFVYVAGRLLLYAIIARVILSWFSMGGMRRGGKFGMFIYDLTEPVINVVRKLPHRIGMLDLAPLIAIFALDFLVLILVSILEKLALSV